jgi:hypothetical protein
MDTTPDPRDPGLEERVSRLEGEMRGVRESLARIEAMLAATLPTLATQLSDLRGDLSPQIAELRGRVATLPTAWPMMTAVVAGQCTLASLLAVIVFGVLKVTGHG